MKQYRQIQVKKESFWSKKVEAFIANLLAHFLILFALKNDK